MLKKSWYERWVETLEIVEELSRRLKTSPFVVVLLALVFASAALFNAFALPGALGMTPFTLIQEKGAWTGGTLLVLSFLWGIVSAMLAIGATLLALGHTIGMYDAKLNQETMPIRSLGALYLAALLCLSGYAYSMRISMLYGMGLEDMTFGWLFAAAVFSILLGALISVSVQVPVHTEMTRGYLIAADKVLLQLVEGKQTYRTIVEAQRLEYLKVVRFGTAAGLRSLQPEEITQMRAMLPEGQKHLAGSIMTDSQGHYFLGLTADGKLPNGGRMMPGLNPGDHLKLE